MKNDNSIQSNYRNATLSCLLYRLKSEIGTAPSVDVNKLNGTSSATKTTKDESLPESNPIENENAGQFIKSWISAMECPRLFFKCRGLRANGRIHNLTCPVLVDVRSARGRKETAVRRSLSMCLIWREI
jgi:hypothetical protein